ncbi:MAG: hypothetical protein J5449_10750 [Oscillospiraceae bacterium]|nr:hypothetical protein [Oscillospiraceae bacterium]
MELYKKLYFTLFGKVEDALELMDEGKLIQARKTLLDALNDAEETYVTASEEPAESKMRKQ